MCIDLIIRKERQEQYCWYRNRHFFPPCLSEWFNYISLWRRRSTAVRSSPLGIFQYPIRVSFPYIRKISNKKSIYSTACDGIGFFLDFLLLFKYLENDCLKFFIQRGYFKCTCTVGIRSQSFIFTNVICFKILTFSRTLDCAPSDTWVKHIFSPLYSFQRIDERIDIYFFQVTVF